MKSWYFPSWNGDLRLVASEDDPAKTLLSIVKPTLDEQRIVKAILVECKTRGWVKDEEPPKKTWLRKASVEITASVADLGPVVTAIMRPGPATLTAITFSDGKIVTSSGSPAELAAAVEGGPYREPAPASAAQARGETPPEAERAAAPAPEPERAATVKRHTPSCPQCTPGAIGPASEVLLSFLTPEEHESWAKDRTIVVEGGLSGHRYLLAHRKSPIAAHIGRMCFDLDDNVVVHFHDTTVPPEEEVLAAKLILKYREPWLRNEATLFHAGSVLKFKNPFGDVLDGVADATFTQQIGRLFA